VDLPSPSGIPGALRSYSRGTPGQSGQARVTGSKRVAFVAADAGAEPAGDPAALVNAWHSPVMSPRFMEQFGGRMVRPAHRFPLAHRR
jgi:hypothetical protein